MPKGIFKVPEPINERVRNYAPGTRERADLQAEIERLRSMELDIPMVIGGKEVRTDNKVSMHPPHERKHLLGHYHKGDASHVKMAIDAAELGYGTTIHTIGDGAARAANRAVLIDTAHVEAPGDAAELRERGADVGERDADLARSLDQRGPIERALRPALGLDCFFPRPALPIVTPP